MKPTVLLIEPIHPKYLALLERKTRVVRPDGFDEQSLIGTINEHQPDAIVIRTKGCVTAKMIAAAKNLKVVGRHGIGVDHIDCFAAERAGVWVVNTPGGSRDAVAEQTFAMILALAKNIAPADRAVRALDYSYRDKTKAFQLREKTLGVIGLGRIGTAIAEIGVRGFGMKLLYNDLLKFPKKEHHFRTRRVSLRVLLSKSDVVSIHTPLDETTRGLIGARELAWMQPHAILINCARGAIVDAYAVAGALNAKKLGGAGIDVFDPEIPPADHPILKCENAIFSPHYAAQTPEANLGYAAVVEDVLGVLAGKRPKYPVNQLQAAYRVRS